MLTLNLCIQTIDMLVSAARLLEWLSCDHRPHSVQLVHLGCFIAIGLKRTRELSNNHGNAKENVTAKNGLWAKTIALHVRQEIHVHFLSCLPQLNNEWNDEIQGSTEHTVVNSISFLTLTLFPSLSFLDDSLTFYKLNAFSKVLP